MTDPLSRRRFLTTGGGCLLAAPLFARAQDARRAAPPAGVAPAPPVSAAAGEGPSLASPLRAADYRRVRFADPFWAPRQKANRETTVPHLFKKLREVGTVGNFELVAAGLKEGHKGYVFADSDAHKSLQAAAYCLGTGPAPAIAKETEALIDLLRRAQRKDGYLDTAYQLGKKERFTNLRDDHELYCAGHLIEAGVAHAEATGRRQLLDVAVRCADLLERTFGAGPGRREGYPGHPELELALVRLSGATSDQRYFRLAQHFLEHRGEHFFAREHQTPEDSYDGSYWLDDVRIREHQVISGHAVRALYLYCGALDVASRANDETLRSAVERVWKNAVERRMFLTGGLGSSAHNEGFTEDYDLPTYDAYQETCAGVAFVMLNQRLLLLSGDSRYADLVERALYNAVAAGISLSGDRFFYVNPLASRGGHHRQPWFDCACCPPNLARTLASLGQYAYATSPHDVYLNLYAAGTAELETGRGRVLVETQSQYPWEGKVALAVKETSAGPFALRLRQPGWCTDPVTVRVNGEAAPATPRERGYLVLRRDWKPGDTVELELPMPVRRVQAHPWVEGSAGRFALCRGPIVYCLEQADASAPLPSLRLPRAGALRAEALPALGGAVVLHGEAAAVQAGSDDPLYAPLAEPRLEPARFAAVPYAAWDNREGGAMRVWIESV